MVEYEQRIAIITEEYEKKIEEFRKDQRNQGDLINQISGLENDKKNLIKKKSKDDINKAYTITRLTYLEEETKRLK